MMQGFDTVNAENQPPRNEVMLYVSMIFLITQNAELIK